MLPWVWLLGLTIFLALAIQHPAALAAVLIGVLLAVYLLPGNKDSAWALALGVFFYWGLLVLLLPSAGTGTVLLNRPMVSFGPSVTFGGPLTSDDLTVGFSRAASATICVLCLWLAYRIIDGTSWYSAARGLFGGRAALVAPWCFLGDAARTNLGRGNLVATAAGLADDQQNPDPESIMMRWLRLPLLLALTILPLLADSFGLLPGWLPSGATLFFLLCLLSACLGVLLGTKQDGRWSPIVISAAAVLSCALTAQFFLALPGVTGSQSGWLDPPLTIVLAALCLPIATALEVKRA